MATSISEIIQAVQDSARPLSGTDAEFDHLLNVIGDKRFVLIGEASHGTHEFYSIRAQITERLIEEKGFTAVIVEADWPDAYRVNRYVRGAGEDKSAAAALTGFKRFPTWMGAIAMWWSLWNGFARETWRSPARNPRPASTAWICTASTTRLKKC